MAKGSAKRINATNTAILGRLRILILISSGIFLVAKLTLGHPSKCIAQMITFSVTGILSGLFYWQIRSLATATTSNDEASREAGLDLEGPGLHQYMMDYIYIVAATHLLATLSSWAWYLLLLMPAYGVYRLLKYLANRNRPHAMPNQATAASSSSSPIAGHPRNASGKKYL